MIKFKCEFCDQRLGVPDDFIGKRVRCTKCRAVNTVPSAEERAAKDAAKSTATLSAAPQATLPSEPPRVASHSSLLDLSAGSGSFGMELPVEEASVTDSQIFGTKKTIPAFDAQSQTAARAAAAPTPAEGPSVTKGGTAFGVKLADDLSGDEAPPRKGEGKGEDKSADKSAGKKASSEGDEEEFGLGLLENDPTDSTTGSQVDLDGLGF